MYNLLLYKTVILRSLVTMLEDEGIAITTAAAVDMEKILAGINFEKLEKVSDLKYLLAPLLCRNKEDQDKAYKIFDKLDIKFKQEYINIADANKAEAPAKPVSIKDANKPPRKWFLKKFIPPALIIIALVIAAYFLLMNIKPVLSSINTHKINIIATPQQVIINDSVQFNAVVDSSFKPGNITVDWKFPDTVISNQTVVHKVIHDTASIVVKAILKNTDGIKIDSNTYSITALCEAPPSVAISESDIAVNGLKAANSNKKQFEPLFTNARNESLYTYKWFVDDSLYSQEKILKYAKPYNTIRLFVNLNHAHCSTDSLDAQVESTPALNASITGDGNLKIQSAYNWKNILSAIFFLLVLPLVIAFIAYKIILSFKTFLPDIKQPEPGTEGPYAIEFVQQQQNINTEQGINKLADVLRKRQVSDVYKLNLRKTIRSTVVAGGIPTLEFTPLSKPLSFLAFIDKENADSHLVKLFEYLVEKLNKEQVNIFVYSYFKEPLFLNNEKLNQDRIPLEKVAALYPDTALFIFGDAQYFLYPLKGTVKNWVTRKLNNWTTKILITPYTVHDWDKKEKLLIESDFVVLPADLSSVEVIDKIVSRQIDVAAQKKEHLDKNYRSRFINFQDFETLKAYLRDALLVQWVCSLAVYPTADWNFTIAMGKAIEQQLQQNNKPDELVNYTNLLKIARMSWMQDGIINESLRVQMLAYLNKDEEALARKTLSKQLQLIESTISKDSLVKTNFDIHTKLNSFLLDAYYHKKTSNADDAFIKKLIENNQLDEGQDIYLNKGDNTLLHHPLNKKNTISIRDYLQLKSSKQKIFSAVCGLIIFVALALLAFAILKSSTSYLNWYSVKPSAQDYTVNIQGNNFNKEVNFDLYYEPAHTRWRSQQINLANTNFSFKYDSVVLIDTFGYGVIKLSTADGKLITQDSFKLNSLIYTINIKEAAKAPLTIFYKNAAGLAMANSFAENLPSNFSVQIQQLNSSESYNTGVAYFSKQHEQEASDAAARLSTLFNKQIEGPQLLDSSSTLRIETKNSDIVVFINEAAKCTPLAITALPQSINEIWHGGTSNRLVNIDLKRKVIYYSTGIPQTYGSYSIYTVCLTQSGAYKIITKANGGFNVFFIKNITQNSFDFSVCETIRSKTAEEIENMDESYCDHFNTMTLYYENNPNVVYLPVSGISLAKQELAKFNTIAGSIQNASATLQIVCIKNSKFISDDGIPVIKKVPGKGTKDVTIKDSSSNPFRRYYLTFRKTTYVNSYSPDCSKTFYSIDETQKLASPLIVCKLDLSKNNLTSLPKEIYDYKNLSELNLGTTSIPEADINALEKALPKCKVIYTTQQVIPNENANNADIPTNKEINLGSISIDEKGGIDSKGRQLINAIGIQLNSSRLSKIKLEANYRNSQQYSIIESGLKTIMNSLEKQGAASSQITTAITEAMQQQQQQKEPQKKAGPAYSNITIQVIGVNFPADFNTQQKSAY